MYARSRQGTRDLPGIFANAMILLTIDLFYWHIKKVDNSPGRRTAAPTGQAAWRHQLRVARPSPGADYLVELAATDPMPVAGVMRFTTPGQTVDPGPWLVPTSPGSNEYRVSDPILTRSLVSGLRRQRIARWNYRSADGPAEAYFSLMGMTAALNWIDCRGAGAS